MTFISYIFSSNWDVSSNQIIKLRSGPKIEALQIRNADLHVIFLKVNHVFWIQLRNGSNSFFFKFHCFLDCLNLINTLRLFLTLQYLVKVLQLALYLLLSPEFFFHPGYLFSKPPIINFQSFLLTFLSVNSRFHHSPS